MAWLGRRVRHVPIRLGTAPRPMSDPAGVWRQRRRRGEHVRIETPGDAKSRIRRLQPHERLHEGAGDEEQYEGHHDLCDEAKRSPP